jgi:hypothetical protein
MRLRCEFDVYIYYLKFLLDYLRLPRTVISEIVQFAIPYDVWPFVQKKKRELLMLRQTPVEHD